MSRVDLLPIVDRVVDMLPTDGHGGLLPFAVVGGEGRVEWGVPDELAARIVATVYRHVANTLLGKAASIAVSVTE